MHFRMELECTLWFLILYKGRPKSFRTFYVCVGNGKRRKKEQESVASERELIVVRIYHRLISTFLKRSTNL